MTWGTPAARVDRGSGCFTKALNWGPATFNEVTIPFKSLDLIWLARRLNILSLTQQACLQEEIGEVQ